MVNLIANALILETDERKLVPTTKFRVVIIGEVKGKRRK